MKLTVVGYWGGFPGKNEATSGYLLEANNFKLLIDCGSGVISQLQNYVNPEELDAVIISHYHNDHVSDIGALQYARLIKGYIGNKPPTLLIYGHKEDLEGYKKLAYKNITKAVVYNPNEQLEIGPFTINFLKTKHPVTCYSMKIKSEKSTLIYTADSAYMEEFVPFCNNADLLLCECNLYEGMDGSGPGHMASTDAGTLANNAQVKHLLLTHLPHFGDHADLVKQARNIFKGKISIAKSGLVFEI